MYKKYTVICVSNAVRHNVYSGSYANCLRFCRWNRWEFDYNGGLVWDLEIVSDR